MSISLSDISPDRLGQLQADYGAVVARRRRQSLLALVVLAVLALVAGYVGEFDVTNLADHAANLTSYFGRIMPDLKLHGFIASMEDWYWGFFHWLKLLLDTLLIAYLATLFGSIGAGLMAVLAAMNLAPDGRLRWGVKRLLEFCRTVPDLVFALMFVSAFGLGPLAGILAIGIHTFGTLGKLFTEVIENIDMKPVEGVRSTGGRFMHVVRYAVLPQVLPNLASYTLLRFEINVRSGAVVGIVGAGGIGQDLFVAIRKFYYTDVSALLLMIIITVAITDLVTERIRHRFSAGRAQ